MNSPKFRKNAEGIMDDHIWTSSKECKSIEITRSKLFAFEIRTNALGVGFLYNLHICYSWINQYYFLLSDFPSYL